MQSLLQDKVVCAKKELNQISHLSATISSLVDVLITPMNLEMIVSNAILTVMIVEDLEMVTVLGVRKVLRGRKRTAGLLVNAN